ncbi:hypothetical protein ACVWZ4_007224 [Bradyrhizobium sp. USDA 4472]
MREFITIFLLAWLPGFLLTLLLNVGGPPTIGLALLRATVWPVFIATGRPEGTRMEAPCNDDQCG